MSWLSLTFRTESIHVDLVSDRLLALGALSVDVHDAGEGTEQEQPLFGEPGTPPMKVWEQAEITALLEENCDIDAIMQAVVDVAELAVQPPYNLTQVKERDWVRLTQSQFEPIQVSQRLWVVPSWHELPDPAAINLRLDPGLAFGTGSHPTTRLCLAWLDANLQTGEKVLDYGCGSGILAIAALKLGAHGVIGIDIDPNAITASLANAQINDCDPDRLQFSTEFSLSNDGEAEAGRPPITVVVANILANPLIVLAPILTHALQPGGRIALSGILEAQADEVLQAYEPWFSMQISASEQGWVLLTGKKRAVCLA
ncbi:50S ribosomal protein L11 methyltransferase [Nitrosomonas halophila]|uniref:Ribosomal protein L11 methyltransferase n=1 Tax=Nitrosomonas halophila TaxID=44576 RepID=A0A1H3LPL9_9PROT|nr:50S ribosomal protein L11 methyltransferase [Nitrosomonas halophila]SDY66266.1 ribosomal protein L11 methyltransferase [Nitrosomonas halophila]